MVPQYVQGEYFEVDTSHGTVILPIDLVGDLAPGLQGIVTLDDDGFNMFAAEFSPYVEGTVFTMERGNGVCAHLTAPGYLDQTDWMAFASLQEAYDSIVQNYEVDPITGQSLDELELELIEQVRQVFNTPSAQALLRTYNGADKLLEAVENAGFIEQNRLLVMYHLAHKDA